MEAAETGSTIDGFVLGEKIHIGTMATIFRLAGPNGPLPLVMKIPRLGPGERAVNVIGFEVCRTVLGALAQGRHHPTLVAYGDVESTPYLVIEYVDGPRLDDWLERTPLPTEEVARLGRQEGHFGEGARLRPLLYEEAPAAGAGVQRQPGGVQAERLPEQQPPPLAKPEAPLGDSLPRRRGGPGSRRSATS